MMYTRLMDCFSIGPFFGWRLLIFLDFFTKWLEGRWPMWAGRKSHQTNATVAAAAAAKVEEGRGGRLGEVCNDSRRRITTATIHHHNRRHWPFAPGPRCRPAGRATTANLQRVGPCDDDDDGITRALTSSLVNNNSQNLFHHSGWRHRCWQPVVVVGCSQQQQQQQQWGDQARRTNGTAQSPTATRQRRFVTLDRSATSQNVLR